MATFKCYNDLLGETLQEGDEVIFCLETGEVLDYEVYIGHLYKLYLNKKLDYNGTIFQKLGLNKFSFCEQHYGYKVDQNVCFPETRPNDFEALTRVTLALFKIIEEIPRQLVETSELLFID